MFDAKRTLELIKGALLNPAATWDSYLSEADDWRRTATLLTLPLVVGCGVLGYLLALVVRSHWYLPGIGGLLLQLIVGLAGAAVIAFIFAFFAGVFKGKNDFARALAATQLAFVPGYLGQIVAPVPMIGLLASFGLLIYSLVLLWRITPQYLEVPAGDHGKHYAASLVTSFIAMLAIGLVSGAGMVGTGMRAPDFAQDRYRDGGDRAPSGMFGDLERQGALMESAEQDRYEPPEDGRISDAQMQNYLRVLTRTGELCNEQSRRLEKLSKQAENGKFESIGGMFSGIGQTMNLVTAEMEVVKTGGGNWAEHQWIKEQLRIASVQKDLNEAVKHNYALYLKYQKQLDEARSW